MHAVIVTGVSRGLGEALAHALLGSGANVVGIGRTASARLSGPRFRHVACDFGLPSAIAAPRRGSQGSRTENGFGKGTTSNLKRSTLISSTSSEATIGFFARRSGAHRNRALWEQ